MIIKKGRFEHIAAVLNREESRNKISLYRNAKLITTSSQRADFGNLGSAFTAADFLIGLPGIRDLHGYRSAEPNAVLPHHLTIHAYIRIENVRSQNAFGFY